MGPYVPQVESMSLYKVDATPLDVQSFTAF